MAITAVFIKHFQSLKQVTLPLGKLTVVVGSTNVGKSALVRAMKAAVENRRGDTFLFGEETDCQVSFQTQAHAITWFKPYKKSAIYYLSTLEDQRNMQPVPQDMALAALGLRKVELSKAVSLLLNFQNQLDAPFLLAESDVIKSKVLGEITNASLVLISVNQIKRWALHNSSLISIRLQDIANTRNFLEKYRKFDTLVQLKEQAEAKIASLQKMSYQYAELVSREANLREVVKSLSLLSATVNRLRGMAEKILTLYFGGTQIIEDAGRLQDLVVKRQRIEDEVKSAKLVARKIEVVKTGIPDVTKVEQLMSQITVLAGYKDALVSCTATINMFDRESKSAEVMLERAEKDLVTLRKELRICPLCESPLYLDNDSTNHEHEVVSG